jgi:hypothetical protein
MMITIIVIIATTIAAGTAEISMDVATNSTFVHFFLLGFVFYIKVGHEDY